MLAFALPALFLSNTDPVPKPEQLRFFEEKIRPVLVEQCHKCHSAEAASQKKLKGGLALDSRESWQKGGESGPVIVPGKPEQSLLIKSLHHVDDLKMPPKGKLPKSVIADFENWIKMGAPDPRSGNTTPSTKASRIINMEEGRSFWSLRPLAQVEAPRLAQSPEEWAVNPVDRFVLATLQSKGLRPNPSASSRVLIRRAWFDLLGLPPTPEQMDEWVAKLEAGQGKVNSKAWGELIDFLLASPRYGERWARHWMDIARFAESHGYEQDYDRPTAYTYRDFLIRAFNSDMPFDQFARWQLAGDELDPQNPLAWMATGFLGAGAFPTQLTEDEFESARYDELDDMVNTTGVAFLGLTLGCARCHDHKFDPITSKDYYRFAAAYSTVIRSEKELDLDPAGNAERAVRHSQRVKALEADLASFEKNVLPGEFAKYLKSAADSHSPWMVLDGQIRSTANSAWMRQTDGSYLASGKAPARETIVFKANTTAKGIQAIRLEALADPSLPRGGPGRAPNGNFALGDFRVEWSSMGESGSMGKVSLQRAAATHQQNADSLSVGASLDSDPVSGWAVDGQIGKSQAAVFYPAQPINPEGNVGQITITLAFNHPNSQHLIGRFRLSLGTTADLIPGLGNAGPDAETVSALVRLREGQGRPGDEPLALKWFKSHHPQWLAKSSALEKEKKDGGKPVLTKALVTTEGLPHLPHHADDRGFPHFYQQVHLLKRGDPGQKVELVSHGVPEVFNQNGQSLDAWRVEKPSGSKSSYRRASLANWLTDPSRGAGHLVARVAVNRLWQHHFGRGIVATPSDFGYTGAKPTHPELLDWLAADLVSSGWRLKKMHKLIMSSATYRQSSQTDQERLAKDPENQWLWRRVPARLEAEPIRDSLLAVSGQLDLREFGPGTMDQNMKRRSVYFFIKRSGLIPMMMLFDWPEHLVSIGQRSNTTVAPQALAFLNGPQVRSYALAFADRLGPDAEWKVTIDKAFRVALGRSPTREESQLALEFLDRQLAEKGTAKDSRRLALADLCQTIFSMNEFVFVE